MARQARPCAEHPRLPFLDAVKTWMPAACSSGWHGNPLRSILADELLADHGPAFALSRASDICTTRRARRVRMIPAGQSVSLTRRMVVSFVHDIQSQRVVFAPGAVARVAEEAARLGLSHALVIATPGSGARLGGRIV